MPCASFVSKSFKRFFPAPSNPQIFMNAHTLELSMASKGRYRNYLPPNSHIFSFLPKWQFRKQEKSNSHSNHLDALYFALFYTHSLNWRW